MATKIRCSECRKKISVDEAFAGSMCRCPYCKSIIRVPMLASGGLESMGRPSSPGGRPVSPGRSRQAPGGEHPSGLLDVTSSHPIISRDASAPQRAIPRTRIDKPGVPQMPSRKKSKPTWEDVPPGAAPRATPQMPSSRPASPGKIGEVRKKPENTEPIELFEDSDEETEMRETPAEIVEEPIAATTFVPARRHADKEHVVESIRVNVKDLSAAELAAIPTADPVRLQGIVSLVLLLVLVVMGGACVALGIKLFAGKPPVVDVDNDAAYYADDDNAYDDVDDAEPVKEKVKSDNPFQVGDSPAVAKSVSVSGPVIYVVDTGGKMSDMYLYARDIIRASIRSLDGMKFGVILIREKKSPLVGRKMWKGGPAGEKAIKSGITSSLNGGAVDVGGYSSPMDGIGRAVRKKPKTIVLLIRNKEIDDPRKMAGKIKKSKARLVLVVLGWKSSCQEESYRKLVDAVGKDSRLLLYEDDALCDFYDEKDVSD